MGYTGYMENIVQEHTQTEKNMVKMGTWYAPLTIETVFSKYFSMLVFIALPFIGFVVGVGYGRNLKLENVNDLFKEQEVGKQEIMTYERCRELGGAINNVTNDCWINGETYKTSYSKVFNVGAITNSEGVVYVNEQYGVSFSVPEEWTLEEGEGGVDIDTSKAYEVLLKHSLEGGEQLAGQNYRINTITVSVYDDVDIYFEKVVGENEYSSIETVQTFPLYLMNYESALVGNVYYYFIVTNEYVFELSGYGLDSKGVVLHVIETLTFEN